MPVRQREHPQSDDPPVELCVAHARPLDDDDGGPQGLKPLPQGGHCLLAARAEAPVVDDLERPGLAQLAPGPVHGLRERADGLEVQGGSGVLEEQPHPEGIDLRGRLEGEAAELGRVLDDDGPHAPALLDLLGGRRGEGDDPVRAEDQHGEGGGVLLLAVGGQLGVAQVVDRDEEELAVELEGLDESGHVVRGEGLEPEVHMDRVEAGVVGGHPVGVERFGRRPQALEVRWRSR